MNFFVGLDVSKEKFDACGIGDKGEKVFALSCSMGREGFEKLIVRLPKDKTSFLLVYCLNNTFTTIHLFKYLLNLLGPDKGFRVLVVIADIFFYRSHKLL